MTVRPAAVAGAFYPNDAAELARVVDGYLAAATPSATSHAVIAPHAGYVYSGALAGAAYRALAASPDPRVTRVVVIAPAHRMWVAEPTAPSANALATPLGTIAIDPIVDELGIARDDRPHAREHAIEVHLPFIQRLFTNARIVPILASETAPEKIAALLDRLWGNGDAHTRIVISSDLSHFHSYAEAQALDRQTCEHICALDRRPLDGDAACGAVGINGIVRLAAARGLVPRMIGQCNSGDTAGTKTEVVGYGAIAFDAQ